MKLPQITQMDKIYLSAVLTIVAASGESANSGLAGCTPNSRPVTQHMENIAGLRFVSVSGPLLKTMPNLKWYTRAWTYQEFMLSKRLLIFTEDQVYYHCTLRNFCEDSEEKPVPINSTQAPSTIDSHPLWNMDQRHLVNGQRQMRNTQVFHPFERLVENITSRNSTKDEDVLRSAIGVLGAMAINCHEKFICGMPASILEWALLWEPIDQLHERGHTYDGRRFPSWSWTGWKGQIKYHHLFSPDDVTPIIKDWQFYTSSTPSPKLLPYRPIPSPEEAWWPLTTWHPLPNVSDSDAAHAIDIHQATIESLLPLVETGVLSFSAQAATLNIDVFQHSHSYRDFQHNLWRIIHPQTNAWIGVMSFGATNPCEGAANLVGAGTSGRGR